MANPYLSLAKQGKNDWWRYFFSLIVILFFYQVIGIIPYAILSVALTIDSNPNTQFNSETLQFEGIGPLLPYLVVNFVLFSLLAGLYLVLRLVHKRRLITLITPYSRISWKRIFQGFGLYFLLLSTASAIAIGFSPGEYQVTFNPGQFFLFLPIALVLTPIQTTAEELFFRGYLMQGISLLNRKPLVPILGSSVLFMLPHLLNPEAQSNLLLMATLYLCFGLFFAFITVRDNSLELAIGTHAANNLFVALIVNYADSALPSPSIFTASQINPLISLMSFIAIAAIFYLIIFRKRPTRGTFES